MNSFELTFGVILVLNGQNWAALVDRCMVQRKGVWQRTIGRYKLCTRPGYKDHLLVL